MEKQEVIAEVLAVIRGNDHQGIVERTAPVELIEENPQPAIKISNAIIINIYSHANIVYSSFALSAEFQPKRIRRSREDVGRSPKPGIDWSGTS